MTLSWRAPNMEGYPFDIVVTATYSLADDGLHLNISAYNNGDADAPWAWPFHPWLANGFNGYGDEIDAHNAKCSLTVPGRTHVTVNENLIPTGTEPVDGTKYDLRKDTLLTEQPFGRRWTDLSMPKTAPSPRCSPRPDGKKVRVGGDETVTSFQVCTGTGFPAVKHPAGVAVEPQTAYANAFNTGKDLIVIKPGETSSTALFIGMLD